MFEYAMRHDYLTLFADIVSNDMIVCSVFIHHNSSPYQAFCNFYIFILNTAIGKSMHTIILLLLLLYIRWLIIYPSETIYAPLYMLLPLVCCTVHVNYMTTIILLIITIRLCKTILLWYN